MSDASESSRQSVSKPVLPLQPTKIFHDLVAGEGGIAGLVVVFCAALAVLVQTRLVKLGSPSLALYGWVLCFLGIVIALTLWLLGRTKSSDTSKLVASDAMRFEWLIPAAAIGFVCAGLSAHLVATDSWDAQWLWLAGMVIPLVILTMYHLSARRKVPVTGFAFDWRELAGVGGLFVAALAVRAFDITSSPPILHGDEASCGLYGRLFNTGTTPLLSISWYGLPMLS
jgi:hypothetical protein